MTTDQPPSFPPSRIGDRYQLGERVGTGAHGAVYRASDELSGNQVAIKLFDADAAPSQGKAWREAAVLRRLNLPGVVRLLDEGRIGDRPYLVMPLFDGSHFPGAFESDPNAYADVIVSLVELLISVHAAGIVHGDLKPQNVLVDDDRHVTLLDFGTGSWVAGLSSERKLERISGTPAYMAPEQLRGHPASVHSDYYALGVMLYQVFTGELPHPTGSVRELMNARLSRRAPPIDAEAFGISPKLARAVEGLLSPSAERRAQYVGSLLEALDAGRRTALDLHEPVYLDPHGVVDRVVAAIERGESVDVVGRSGFGRSRCLQEVTRTLRGRGHRVISLVASNSAFASLSPLVGRELVDAHASREQAREAHRAHLVDALESGKVVVADNAEKLDQSTRELLEQQRHRGGLVFARLAPFDTGIELEPLSVEHLEALFDGPEPIFQMRSRAARQLWRRSDGVPRAFVREINLWVRHGLAHFRGNKLVVPPQQLERLRRGLQLRAAATSRAIFERDPRDVERTHRQLADALEPGKPGRLLHLLRAGEDAEVLAEARAAAAYHDRRGEAGLAIAALSEAMAVCKQLDDPDATYGLLADWAKVALSTEETYRIEELEYAIGRASSGEDERFEQLHRLVDLARIACQRTDEALLDSLTDLAPFADPALELRRQMYRVRLGVRHSAAVLADVLDDVEALVRRDALGPEGRGSFVGWKGMQAYQRGEFREASDLYLEAALLKQRPSAKLASIINAVNALMDGLAYGEALEHAQAALERAERLDRHRDQAYCHYLLCSLRYRRGEPLGIAPDLHEALELLGSSELIGLTRLVEAADALRRGDDAAALDHARQACEAFERTAHQRGVAIARALVVRCGGKVEPWEVERLAAYAQQEPAPRIGIQILGLLLGAPVKANAQREGVLRELAARIPRDQWSTRLEVISIDEALASAGVAPPSG